MPDLRRPSAEEVRLAQEEKDEQIARFTHKRQISLVCGVCLLMAAIVIAILNQPILALCATLGSAIAFVTCFDSHGALAEARRTGAVSLFTDLSILETRHSPLPVNPSTAQQKPGAY